MRHETKLLAYRILRPVIAMQDEVRLICLEAPLVDLLADLSDHKHPAVLAITQAARNKLFV